MIEMMHGAHGCDVGTSPNRTGYLVLGPCLLPPISLPENCASRPAEPDSGVLLCRCLATRGGPPVPVPPAGPAVTLHPHDLMRAQVTVDLDADE